MTPYFGWSQPVPLDRVVPPRWQQKLSVNGVFFSDVEMQGLSLGAEKVLRLRAFGKSYAEIGRELGVSGQRAKSMVKKALARLVAQQKKIATPNPDAHQAASEHDFEVLFRAGVRY